ncbi:hypothetical protein QT711_07315 [Sporosarcina saromensis]|uniref:Phage shock protein B n=1 Tax=Sporosarcina saromensis TaxID=359365 RepID=A0ABU4G9G9_9BACL|nr:hypothetical protein [Sporosarcina saromensis]MDW0112990.1 hypothetical protein [Sporosarcina saromensis]
MLTELFVFTSLFSFVLPILAIIIAVVFIVKTVKRFEKRADERLAIERENSNMLQERLKEMDNRLIDIERLLKEVE